MTVKQQQPLRDSSAVAHTNCMCAQPHTGCQDENFPSSMGNDHSTAALQCKLLLMDLLQDVRAYLIADSQFESLAEQVGTVGGMLYMLEQLA